MSIVAEYEGIIDYLPIIGKWVKVRAYNKGDQTAYTHRDYLIRHGIQAKVDTSFAPIEWRLAVKKEDKDAAISVLSSLLAKELPPELLPETIRPKKPSYMLYLGLAGIGGLGLYFVLLRGRK
jgi:hypothetical protein